MAPLIWIEETPTEFRFRKDYPLRHRLTELSFALLLYTACPVFFFYRYAADHAPSALFAGLAAVVSLAALAIFNMGVTSRQTIFDAATRTVRVERQGRWPKSRAYPWGEEVIVEVFPRGDVAGPDELPVHGRSLVATTGREIFQVAEYNRGTRDEIKRAAERDCQRLQGWLEGHGAGDKAAAPASGFGLPPGEFALPGPGAGETIVGGYHISEDRDELRLYRPVSRSLKLVFGGSAVIVLLAGMLFALPALADLALAEAVGVAVFLGAFMLGSLLVIQRQFRRETTLEDVRFNAGAGTLTVINSSANQRSYQLSAIDDVWIQPGMFPTLMARVDGAEQSLLSFARLEAGESVALERRLRAWLERRQP